MYIKTTELNIKLFSCSLVFILIPLFKAVKDLFTSLEWDKMCLYHTVSASWPFNVCYVYNNDIMQEQTAL